METTQIMQTRADSLDITATRTPALVVDFFNEQGKSCYQDIYPTIPPGARIETAVRLIREEMERRGCEVMIVFEILDGYSYDEFQRLDPSTAAEHMRLHYINADEAVLISHTCGEQS